MYTESDLSKFFKPFIDELNYKKQFKQRKRQMFEILYRLLTQKNYIQQEIMFLEKINGNTDKLVRELQELNRKINVIKQL